MLAVLALLATFVSVDLRSASVPLADAPLATCAFGGTAGTGDSAQVTQVSRRQPNTGGADEPAFPAAFHARVDPQAANVSGGGFKQVTADLLRRVDVKFGDTLVRRYELGYRAGAFDKTLLASIAQLGADGAVFNTHRFDYHDDIRDADGDYQAFERVDWTSPDDDVANDAVNGVSGGSGEAGALNGNTSTGAGGHLYVGFGPSPSKSGSVGVKTGFASGTDEGLLALTDVDGDSLPDKVFTAGGAVTYRKNLSRPGGQARFSQNATPLCTLPGILTEQTESRTVGVEGYAGGVAAQLDALDYSRYQALGYLDIASRSMAGNSGRMPAFLTYVTPSDASMALGISERAANTNVAIWRSKLYRDIWAAPGEGLLVGPPEPMNGPAWSLTGDPSLRVQELVGQPVSLGTARLPNPIPFDSPDFEEDKPW
jgi:hypothetical protein